MFLNFTKGFFEDYLYEIYWVSAKMQIFGTALVPLFQNFYGNP